MRRFLVVLPLVWAGCDDEGPAAAASASAASSPAVSSSVAPPAPPPAGSSASPPKNDPATLDVMGERRGIGSALAFTEGGSGIRIVVSTHRRFCDNIRGKNIVGQSGEMFFGVTIVNELEGKTNTRRLRIRENRFGNRIKSFVGAAGGPVEILDGSADEGKPLKVRLRTSAFGATLDGIITATGCGNLLDDIDAVPPPAGVEIAVAGERHVIQSARVMGGRSPALVLSTARLSCRDERVLGDLWVSIKAAADGKGGEIVLGGDAHDKSRADGDNLPKVEIGIEQNQATSDFTFAIEGDLKIGDYDVNLTSKGVATNCP